MFNVFPSGIGEILKKTKYGIWILIKGEKIFIHYSETFTKEGVAVENPIAEK